MSQLFSTAVTRVPKGDELLRRLGILDADEGHAPMQRGRKVVDIGPNRPLPFLPEVKSVRRQLREYARSVIMRYFEGRDFHAGGPIPRSTLTALDVIDRVIDQSYQVAIPLAQEWLIDEGSTDSFAQDFDESDDASATAQAIIRSILDRCAMAKVPKCLSGGILLLELELCEGITPRPHSMAESNDLDPWLDLR